MTTNNKQGRSPLRCIPKAATVRERLQKVLREAAELKILLRTAEATNSLAASTRWVDSVCA